MTGQTATTSLMRSINRSTILDLIRRESPLARSEMARRLDMGLPTVVRIVDALIAEDLVRPCGASESTGGRPRPLIEFNGPGHAVIGIDLGGDRMLGAVADLSGAIQHEVAMPGNGEEAEANLGLLCTLIERLLAMPRPANQRLRGISIGAPGITLSPQGIVALAPSLGWRDLPLKEILAARFDLPVFVENDVKLAALGEWSFGVGQGLANLVYITLGTGLGAGIILNGALYRGGDCQASGEIGYLPPGVAYLGRRYEGFGALERLASTHGITARAQAALRAAGRKSDGALLIADVFAAARRGESWAQHVVAETVDYLSLAVANVAALLDPDVIVLGGEVVQEGDLLLGPISERLDGVLVVKPRLAMSALAGHAAIMGAITLVLNGTTDRLVVNRLH